MQFAYTLFVKSQPKYAAYTVRETVEDAHGRVVQRLTHTVRTSKTATVSMPPVRLVTSGRWTFSTTVSAGGQTKKTSASIRVV